MEICVMGTSCTWFARENTSFVIDKNIILDLPEGTYKNIVKKFDIYKMDYVLISHLHIDHFFDIHILATQIMRYDKNRKTKLKVFGPKGTAEKLIEINKLMLSAKDQTEIENYLKVIDFIEIEDGSTYEVGKYQVKAYKVEHGIAETFGFSFFENGKKLAGFTADTVYCNNVQNIVEGAKVAFVDFTTIEKHIAHMSKDDYFKIVQDNKNTKVYPVHTCDATQEYIEKNNLNPLKDGDIIIV